MSRLVVMGSGETSPTMLRIHREIFATCPPGSAVILDTTFAFQTNRQELIARTRSYFARSVGHDVDVAAWSGAEDATQQARSLALIDRATWVFAGPGSPTYALRQWRGTAVPGALAGVVRRGGTVLLGSAAALTVGTHTVPVYEIYKVGADPEWVDGLDLLGELTGLAAVVVPHYDNKEGATHDTRFCYLGEARLAALEAQLPEHVGVLGVDEHTAMFIDIESRTMTVEGNGLVSVRRRGETVAFAPGQRLGLDELAGHLRGESSGTAPQPARSALTPTRGDNAAEPPPSLRAESERARAAFDEAVARRDIDGCIGAILRLENALAGWQADTLQGDDETDARRTLRTMVVRLGELAHEGLVDPADRVKPLVEALLAVRAAARDRQDFALSDLARDRLVEAGVEVRDTAEGTEWSLSET